MNTPPCPDFCVFLRVVFHYGRWRPAFSIAPPVVTGTTQQYIDPISCPPLEPVPPRMTIRLPMPDHRLDGRPPLETLLPPPGHEASPPPGYGSLALAMPRSPRSTNPSSTDRPVRRRTGSRADFRGCPSSGFLASQNEVAPVRRDHAHLHAELIPPVGFALTDARHFRCRQAVPLVAALLLLRPQRPSHRQLVRNHPTQVRPQTPGRTVQTAELAGVALPPSHPMLSAPPHPPHLGTVQPLAVRRESHGLVRHRRLHGDPPPRPRLHGPALQTRIHRCLADPLGTGCPEARAASRQTARVDRRMGRELFLATKIRPIRILHPTRHHGLVRPWVDLLEILPPDHQTGGLARATAVRVPLTESLVVSWPIQGPGQVDERMAQVQQVFQAVSEPIVGCGERRGLGRIFSSEMARNGASMSPYPAI